MVVKSQSALDRLQAALLNECRVASLTLHDGRAPQPGSMTALEPALACTASTLAALHGLFPEELEEDLYTTWRKMTGVGGQRELGLAAFTQLRALTLRFTWRSPRQLTATVLPASLEELTLAVDGWRALEPRRAPGAPLLIGFRRLPDLGQKLRRITFVGQQCWPLGSRDDEAENPERLQLPPSIQVFTHVLLAADVQVSCEMPSGQVASQAI